MEELRYGMGESSLGPVLVAMSDRGAVAILTGKAPQAMLVDLEELFPLAELTPDQRGCREAVEAVITFIEKPVARLALALDLRGTPFQKKVWQAVRDVPLGKTRSYGDIASQIGSPRAMRAVGTACASSRHSVAVPCHRVLRKDGSPSAGDFWGDDRHRILLEREAEAARATRTSRASKRAST